MFIGFISHHEFCQFYDDDSFFRQPILNAGITFYSIHMVGLLFRKEIQEVCVYIRRDVLASDSHANTDYAVPMPYVLPKSIRT